MNITFNTAKGHNLQDGEVFDYVDARPAYRGEPIEVIAISTGQGRFDFIATSTGRLAGYSNPATRVGIVDGSRD